MIRIVRTFLAAALSAGMLGTPVMMFALRSPPGQNRREASDWQRIYDRDRKDYHDWNESEDRAYRRYWQGRHRAYRDFSRLKHRRFAHQHHPTVQYECSKRLMVTHAALCYP